MPLSTEQIARAAAQLTEARNAKHTLHSLDECTPTDHASAYEIAEAHARQLDTPSVGWKVGCTSQEAMDILSSPGPFSGRIFEGTVHDSPASEGPLGNPGLECEFAFLLGRDLPPTGTPYTVDDVRNATDAVAPAIELVAPRFADFTGVGYLSLIADSGANAGAILGEPVAVDALPELGSVEVELKIDDTVISTGIGSAILGDPWQALVWLANHLSERGIGLRAGEFVLSGTCTGIDPLPQGSIATARHSGFEPVTVRSSAP